LVIWGAFAALLYLARDFFFTAFMTFVFYYLTLAAVGWLMRRVSPSQERPGLRRLLTLGVFVLPPLVLIGVGMVLGPRLVEQAERVAGWADHVSPEGEVSRVLEGWVSHPAFKDNHGGPEDPRHQKALEEFRQTGESHVAACNEFPQLKAWLEAGFSKKYLEAERVHIRIAQAAFLLPPAHRTHTRLWQICPQHGPFPCYYTLHRTPPTFVVRPVTLAQFLAGRPGHRRAQSVTLEPPGTALP
jgi:hypothetical protein